MSSLAEQYEKFIAGDGLSSSWVPLRTALLKDLMAEREKMHGKIDTLDLILLERISYLYARIRQKEAAGAFGNERNYKSAVTLLGNFMAEVRKADNRQELLELIKADAIDVVVKSIKEAVQELPEDSQKQVLGKVLTLVHDADAHEAV